VAFFRYLCEDLAEPGRLLPSARRLLSAFTACCVHLPDEGDADLLDSFFVARLPALREELEAFLQTHLDADGRRWKHSLAWTELALAGYSVSLGQRERGPTAAKWCAGLSDLELVFEAVDCLFTAHMCVQDWLLWLDKRESGLDLWESVRLPEEEENVLVAELGVDSNEKAPAFAKAAREERFSADHLSRS